MTPWLNIASALPPPARAAAGAAAAQTPSPWRSPSAARSNFARRRCTRGEPSIGLGVVGLDLDSPSCRRPRPCRSPSSDIRRRRWCSSSRSRFGFHLRRGLEAWRSPRSDCRPRARRHAFLERLLQRRGLRRYRWNPRRARHAEDQRDRISARDADGHRSCGRDDLVLLGAHLVRARGEADLQELALLVGSWCRTWRLLASASMVTFAPSTGLPVASLTTPRIMPVDCAKAGEDQRQGQHCGARHCPRKPAIESADHGNPPEKESNSRVPTSLH